MVQYSQPPNATPEASPEHHTIWQSVPCLSDAEFDLLKEGWRQNHAVLRAVMGVDQLANDREDRPWIIETLSLLDCWVFGGRLRTHWVCQSADYDDRFFWVVFSPSDRTAGVKAWQAVAPVLGKDRWRPCMLAVAARHLFRGEKQLTGHPQDEGRWWCVGFAPRHPRWLVTVPCLLTELVRMAERRRELERQLVAPAPPADARPAAPAAPAEDNALRRLGAVYGPVIERLVELRAVLDSPTLTVAEKLEKLATLAPIPPEKTAEEIAAMLGCNKGSVIRSAWWRRRIEERHNL